MSEEIRCQFIILARKDELTPDFRAKRRTDTGFPRPRISGPSRRNRTCIFGRYYTDTVRNGRFQGTFRRAPPFSGAPAARGRFAF